MPNLSFVLAFRNLLLISVLLGQAALAWAEPPSFRIDIPQLKQSLADQTYKVIDARPHQDFLSGHIPGAINLPESFTYQDKKNNGLIQQPQKMQAKLRALGLDTKDSIVIYDSGQLTSASRLFWVLEVYGFQDLKVLNNGFSEWQALKHPISKQQPTINPSQYVVSINHRVITTKLLTQIATHSSDSIIVDARSAAAYKGETSSAKRFGHIPTAVSIPVHNNFNETEHGRSFLPTTQLKKLYRHIPKNKKLVLYCDIGLASSANYLVLKELGYDVSNYDASWREWGNDESLPIETLKDQ